MELRKIIRTDIAASAVAHLTLVALIILISEVHPFHAAAPETVSVDIVTPEQVKEEGAKAEEKAQEQAKEKPPELLPDLKLPKLDFTDKDKAEAAPKPATKPQAAAPSPQASPEPQQKQPQPQPSRHRSSGRPNVQPQPQQPQPSQQPPPQPQQQPPPRARRCRSRRRNSRDPPQAMQQPQAAPPAYQAPEPDVGRSSTASCWGCRRNCRRSCRTTPPRTMAAMPRFIAPTCRSEVIAALRRHLKSCAKLPGRTDRQRQHQAAHGVRHRRHTGPPADPDRSSAIREGRGHREIRDPPRSWPASPTRCCWSTSTANGRSGPADLAAGLWREGSGSLHSVHPAS